MVSEHWTDRLSEYLDEELGDDERRACAAHLDVCAECSGTLDDLRFLRDQAALLPPRASNHDLWPGIEARLAPRDAVGRAVRPLEVTPPTEVESQVLPLRARRRVSLTVPQLIAASVALMVLSAGAYRVMAPAEPDASPADPVSAARVAGDGTGSTASATPVMFAAAYEQAIEELEAEFRSRRSALDPETVRVVDRNLAIIDTAIEEARAALAEDPSSGFLNAHAAGAMRQKVDLLRRVATIAHTEI